MLKKISLLILVSALLLSGCQFLQKKEDQPVAAPVEIQLERKVGIIGSALHEGVQNPIAPFILLTQANEQIPINSLSVNFKKYRKRRVEASGRWNDARTIFEVENMTSLGHEVDLKETYLNANLGIKFLVPSIFELRSETSFAGMEKVIITPFEVEPEETDSVDLMIVERTENNRRVAPREWLSLDQEYRSLDANDASIYQKSTIGIGQLDAVKKTSPEGDTVDFFVSRDSFIYRFTHRTVNDADRDIYKNAFYDIVQSFEFVPFGEQKSKNQDLKPTKGAESSAEASLKKGFSPLALRLFNANIQYPAKWYWSVRGRGYAFSSKPVDADNVLVLLSKNPTDIPSSMEPAGMLGGRETTQTELNGVITLCVEEEAKYCASGKTDQLDVMKEMLETFEVTKS